MYGNPYYKPYWQTEDPEDSLEHYGVLGMKWGVRKDPAKAYNRAGRKFERLYAKSDKSSRRFNKSRRNIDYVIAKIDGKKLEKQYNSMVRKFSNVKFSDFEKSKLNQKYIKRGNSYALITSLFKGTAPKYVIPEMSDLELSWEERIHHG